MCCRPNLFYIIAPAQSTLHAIVIMNVARVIVIIVVVVIAVVSIIVDGVIYHAA